MLKLRDVARRQARRAFVVEFAGTPKAGKSTSVALIEQFFRDCGYRVHLLKERAAECPLPMKGHFFFNTWTTCSMVTEVLANVDTDADLLILDRGFFDALMWLELQKRRGQVTEHEYTMFSGFVLLDRWRKLVDATIVMRVNPDQAMSRENQTRLLPKEGGSVMNPVALAELNTILDDTKTKHAGAFQLIKPPCQTGQIREDNCALIECMLESFGRWADPPILSVPRTVLAAELGTETQVQLRLHGEAGALLAKLAPSLQIGCRSEAEEDSTLVQLVGCGLLVDQSGNYFVLRRSDRDSKASSYGKYTLWKGCHLEEPDGLPANGAELDQFTKDAVRQRIKDDFYLALDLVPTLCAFAWHPDERHCGLLYSTPIGNDTVAANMKAKEFRKQGRFETVSGRFLSRADAELLDGLEKWSKAFLGALP